MTSVPGVDHPEEQSEAEVTLVGRGISVSTRVEFVNDGVIVVRPSVSEFVEQVVAATADRVEIFWKAGDETRGLPAEVLQVEQGAVVRWRLQITGEAEVSQRRKAVRARVALPVEIGFGSYELNGETVDLSEAGMRAACDGFGVLPENGTRLDLVLKLEEGGPLTVKAEAVRIQSRGARWVLSIRFLDLPEKEGDRVRRRVFQALREERARLAD
jgi:hypothetical protein